MANPVNLLLLLSALLSALTGGGAAVRAPVAAHAAASVAAAVCAADRTARVASRPQPGLPVRATIAALPDGMLALRLATAEPIYASRRRE